MLNNGGVTLCKVKVKVEAGEREVQHCAPRGILPGQLHPFGKCAAMRCLRGTSDARMSLAEEEKAQMGTERRPLPGFKKLLFYIHQTEKNCHIFKKTYLKSTYKYKPFMM